MLMMEDGLSMFTVSLGMTTLYTIKYTHKVNLKIPILSATSRECDHTVEMRVAFKVKQIDCKECHVTHLIRLSMALMKPPLTQPISGLS